MSVDTNHDINTMAQHVTALLQAMTLNMDSPHLEDTPTRFAKYLLEYCQPMDTGQILKGFPAEEGHGIVAQSDIPFRAMCAHHLLPMHGHAAVGYIPGGKIVGLSKLTRLVQAVGHHRPTLQEYAGDDIVDALMEHLQPFGAICVIRAHHACMSARGVKSPDTITTTSSIRGVFAANPYAKQEFMQLVRV